MTKYVHQVAKISPIPANATTPASNVHPASPCTTALIEATEPMIPFPERDDHEKAIALRKCGARATVFLLAAMGTRITT
jgi:hypothetical protein